MTPPTDPREASRYWQRKARTNQIIGQCLICLAVALLTAVVAVALW